MVCEHRVPLSSQVIKLLKSLPTRRTTRSCSSAPAVSASLGGALQMLMKRMGRTDVTVHGFRSTFSDWCHERTGANNLIVEMSLAHIVGSDVERSYRRSDLFAKRAKLMADWAASPLRRRQAVPWCRCAGLKKIYIW